MSLNTQFQTLLNLEKQRQELIDKMISIESMCQNQVVCDTNGKPISVTHCSRDDDSKAVLDVYKKMLNELNEQYFKLRKAFDQNLDHNRDKYRL